jgi:hypothetical protein
MMFKRKMQQVGLMILFCSPLFIFTSCMFEKEAKINQEEENVNQIDEKLEKKETAQVTLKQVTFDSYGGCEQIKGEKTGFFHLEKQKNRWMFYTPKGNGFVPIGISGMHAQQGQWNGLMKNGKSHRDSCIKKYGSMDNWKKATAKRIRDWGFNYTGCFSYTTLEKENVPYILTLSLTKYAIDHRFGPTTGNFWYELGNNYICPDLWNPDLPEFMEKRFLEVTRKRNSINDSNLLYYYPDELDQLKGFADYANHLGWAALVGEEMIGSDVSKRVATKNKNNKMMKNYTKIRFVKYIDDRYKNNIADLNKAWGTDFKDFTAILKVRRDKAKWGWARNPQRKGFPQYRKDLDGFISLIGAKYVKLVKNSVYKYDKKHLIGFQLYGKHPNKPLMIGMKKAGNFDFYMADWDGKDYDLIQRPFMRLLYPSACNDSPLAFKGNCDKWELCLDAKGEKPAPLDYSSLKKKRMYLKIWDNDADYWFRLKFAGGRLPISFKNIPIPRKTINTPWIYQVLYTGKDKNGKSWFTVRSSNPYGAGRAWELMEGLETLKKLGKKGEYIRSTAISHTNFETQDERGKWWAKQIAKIAENKSPNGIYFLTGAEWWKYMDNGWTYWVEQINWGLVSLNDNAYDGKEATKLGADGKAGTWDDETKDYGDSLTPVIDANKSIYEKILKTEK